MSVFSCRPSARAAAVVASVAVLLVLPCGAAAQSSSSIANVEVLQPGPGRIQEDYRAGSDILVSVTVVIPIGAPETELYFSIEAGDRKPVDFASRFSDPGAKQWCYNAPEENSPKVVEGTDLLVLDHLWMDDTHPGTGKLTSDGMGSPSGVTVSAGDKEGEDASAERQVVYSVAFAVVCDDERPEPDEQFTIRAWLMPAGQMDRKPPSGAVARSVLVIDDDTLRPPRNLVLSVSGTTVTVSWDEPDSTDSVQPDGYDLRHREVGPNDAGWTDPISSGNKLTDTVPNLKRGSTYRFQVRSTKTGSMPSDWSDEVRITIPGADALGTPTNVEAFMQGVYPAVTWEPPENAGDSSVSYEVQWRDELSRVWRPTQPVALEPDDRVYQLPIQGRVGGEYEFRVRAVSADGAGPWSAPSTVTVSELSTPSAPLNVEAFIGPDGPAVLWEPPAPVAGVVVSGYEVSWRDDVDRGWRQPAEVDAEARTWPLGVAAVPGRTYEFRVRAVSDDRRGPWSAPATVTAPAPRTPSTPLDVEAFIGPDGPAVLWEPPAPVAGADVIRYDVSWRTDVDPVWTDYSSVVGGPDARTWAPMVAAVPGRRYEFRVRATSATGAGAWSVPAIVVAPELPTPSAPLNLRLASDGGDLVATWDEPADIDSIPVTGYTLRFRGTGMDDSWRTEDVPAGTLRSRIPASYGLVRGGTYRVQVRALGAGGPGPWSAEAETTIAELILPGLPIWLEPMEVAGGGIALSWEEPRNAAEATVSGYEVAIWSLTAVEPPSSANVLRQSDQLGHTYQPGVIPPGCQYTARVRAVGENGRGDYAYMPAARLSGPVCEDLLPSPPTGVEAEAGGFDELARTRGVSVTWSQDGAVEAQFHLIRFSAAGGGRVQTYRTSEQPFVASRAAGRWRVDVQAGVTVDGASGQSAWSEAVEFEVSEPPPFLVSLRDITVKPQSRHGCRPYNGPIEGKAEAYLSPGPLPYSVEAEAASTGAVDVQLSSARDLSLSFTFLPGEVTHPLTTWVDCGVRDGERAEVGITGVTPPTRYSGRVFADPAVHEVDVGDLTPVPSVPAAAAVLLGAVLAGLGALRLRRVSRLNDPSVGAETTTRTQRPAETQTAARTRIEPDDRPPNENQPSRDGGLVSKPRT